jgi:hypothetical protein
VTAKTPRDVPEDAADVDAVEPQDASAEEAPARPVRRKRRVRVIEVLDDEDLDEVLDAMDAEEEAEAEEPAPKPARSVRTTKTAKAAPKAEPVLAKAEEEDDEPAPRERSKPRPEAAAVSLDGERSVLGMRTGPAIVMVVVTALLASLAIWQWRTAAGLADEKDERAAVTKVAREYGDVALNYNAANYQAQMKKAEGLMGGDLLESFKANTLPNLGNTFKQNPELVLTSKTSNVFVGSIDDRFASATIAVDVGVKTAEGTNDAPATLIRLAIAKLDGKWKVTKMYASGVNDQNQGQNQGLPTVPSSSPSTKPDDKATNKPGD